MPSCMINEILNLGGERVLVECKFFLSDIKELKKEILDWIREFGPDHPELAERLESDLLKKMDGYINTLEQMKPGTIVEVM